ncbi:SDR family NAD(P)-dependent oxidoreductase [Candidatus Omnitrophota bacterium]
MDFGIKDKRVLITGGSKNIGAAIAKAFAVEGSKVTIVARSKDKSEQLVKELEDSGSGHDFLIVDLREPGTPTRVANELLNRHKAIDIVIHNVGGGLGQKNPLGPVDEWMKVWHFNVGIAIEMNAVLVPVMKKQQWGRIVHISSISAQQGEPLRHPYGGALPYAAAKSYLNAYVKGLSRELARENIVVSALMPGVILSEGKYWEKLQKTNPDLVNDFLNKHYAIGRFGKADEIASFAVFMASQQASYAIGSIVSIDGGRM